MHPLVSTQLADILFSFALAFVNVESLSAPNRTLSVICDVSADT